MYETSSQNWFWSIKISCEVLSKLKCRGLRSTGLSTYDFSTLYDTTLPHNLIKEKLLDLIEWTFQRALKTMVQFIWPVMTEKLFFSLPRDRMYAMPCRLLLGPPGFNWCFSFAPELVIGCPGISIVRQLTQSVSPRF